MSESGLPDLTGREYGPFHLRTASEKVEEFVAATTDDPDRWEYFAPPGFAAVALFKTAPQLLNDPEVEPYSRVLLHVDQLFRWHRPLPHEEDVEVLGKIESVRRRGNLYFVTFGTRVASSGGSPFIDAASTFLMTEGEPPSRGSVDEEEEPAWDERAENEIPVPAARPALGEELPPLAKSASRADLVRYAGATRDWNPIHWDHGAAVAAGLGGVICHGLLMAAWVVQAAGRLVVGPRPLQETRLRFRSPLRPAVAAVVVGEVTSADRLTLAVRAGDGDLVTADATIAPE